MLAEAVAPGGLVVGIGLNVTTTPGRAAATTSATSLRLEGAGITDRDTLLRAILRELRVVLDDVPGGQAAYRQLCLRRSAGATGAPGGFHQGVAEGIDDDGRIIVAGTSYGAGDVVHLRALTT